MPQNYVNTPGQDDIALERKKAPSRIFDYLRHKTAAAVIALAAGAGTIALPAAANTGEDSQGVADLCKTNHDQCTEAIAGLLASSQSGEAAARAALAEEEGFDTPSFLGGLATGGALAGLAGLYFRRKKNSREQKSVSRILKMMEEILRSSIPNGYILTRGYFSNNDIDDFEKLPFIVKPANGNWSYKVAIVISAGKNEGDSPELLVLVKRGEKGDDVSYMNDSGNLTNSPFNLFPGSNNLNTILSSGLRHLVDETDSEQGGVSGQNPFLKPFPTAPDETAAPDYKEGESDEADVLSIADVYITYGKYQEAIDPLVEAIEEDNDNLDLRFKLVEAYVGQKDVRKAKETMVTIKEMNGDTTNPSMWNRLNERISDLEGKQTMTMPESQDLSSIDIRFDRYPKLVLDDSIPVNMDSIRINAFAELPDDAKALLRALKEQGFSPSEIDFAERQSNGTILIRDGEENETFLTGITIPEGSDPLNYIHSFPDEMMKHIS